jgi:phosphohistidine phosphatase
VDLILWRHAEALEMREVQDDLDRALTPKGERQALRMAEWLNLNPAVTPMLAGWLEA